MKYTRLILFSLIVVTVVLVADGVACPTCKDGLAAADSQGDNVARGYFYSILLMLLMPFTLAGSFGLYVWREMRRQQQKTSAAAPGPDGSPSSDLALESPMVNHHETHLPTATT